MQVKIQSVNDLFNVMNRQLGVPAVVEMNGKWPQSEFFCLERQIRAIYSAAYSHYTIVGFAGTGGFDFANGPFECLLTYCSVFHKFRFDDIIGAAMRANALFIKSDLRIILRIKDTADTLTNNRR